MQQNPPERDPSVANIPNLGSAIPSGGPYTHEEWKVLAETPAVICRAIMAVAPSGALGSVREVMAMRNSINEVLQKTTNPTLQQLQQHLQSQESAQALWEDAGNIFKDRWDVSNVRQTAINSCQQCVALLKKVSPQDAQVYKEFVYASAQCVAEASKEGGFLGMRGAKAISEAEQSLLNDLSRALEVARA